MNQENLVASRGVPRLNVVRDLVGEGPYSPAAWIPGRLLTNPLRDQPLERQNAGINWARSSLPGETVASLS